MPFDELEHFKTLNYGTTSGLNQEVLCVMIGLAADGITMIIVTQEVNFARCVADRVVVMDKDAVLEVSLPRDFFKQRVMSAPSSLLREFSRSKRFNQAKRRWCIT